MVEKRIFWITEDFCRFECKCGWYIDIHKKGLEFDRRHFEGIRCPECNKWVVHW